MPPNPSQRVVRIDRDIEEQQAIGAESITWLPQRVKVISFPRVKALLKCPLFRLLLVFMLFVGSLTLPKRSPVEPEGRSAQGEAKGKVN
jgi:hypothetical protein